jgi:hypothetical protein
LERGGSSIVGRGLAGWPDHAPMVKPEAVNAVVSS